MKARFAFAALAAVWLGCGGSSGSGGDAYAPLGDDDGGADASAADSSAGDAAHADGADAAKDAPAQGDAASDATGTTDGAGDAATADAAIVDVDQDGIDDAKELAMAAEYYPFYAIRPDDGCPTYGVLFRLSPHPKDPTKLMIWFDNLYNDDCGSLGHAGDDEMFGVVADPTKHGPAGILAIRAISHQGTICQKISECGVCKGEATCDTAPKTGGSYPVVYSSQAKHGSYATSGDCGLSCDFGSCQLTQTAANGPFANAGEPGHPIVSNLTTQAFVTAANGWTHAELMNVDPWASGSFGGAGSIAGDLVDSAFVVDPSGCP